MTTLPGVAIQRHEDKTGLSGTVRAFAETTGDHFNRASALR